MKTCSPPASSRETDALRCGARFQSCHSAVGQDRMSCPTHRSAGLESLARSWLLKTRMTRRPSSSSQLETMRSRSVSRSSSSSCEIASSWVLTVSSGTPNRIRPSRRMIFRASSAICNPFIRPSSSHAWMVEDSLMAVIPPKQCLIKSQGNRRPAMMAVAVQNSLISAVVAAGSTRSFRRSTMLEISPNSRALKGARGRIPRPPIKMTSVSSSQARTR